MHVHPFPARMAPDIALTSLQGLPENYRILDPMSGSGMVVSQASERGLAAWGFDIDPLARLISKVSSTLIDFDSCERNLSIFLELLAQRVDREVEISWIDSDKETRDFIEYWFGEKQRLQLRAFSDLCMRRLRPIDFRFSATG